MGPSGLVPIATRVRTPPGVAIGSIPDILHMADAPGPRDRPGPGEARLTPRPPRHPGPAGAMAAESWAGSWSPAIESGPLGVLSPRIGRPPRPPTALLDLAPTTLSITFVAEIW